MKYQKGVVNNIKLKPFKKGLLKPLLIVKTSKNEIKEIILNDLKLLMKHEIKINDIISFSMEGKNKLKILKIEKKQRFFRYTVFFEIPLQCPKCGAFLFFEGYKIKCLKCKLN